MVQDREVHGLSCCAAIGLCLPARLPDYAIQTGMTWLDGLGKTHNRAAAGSTACKKMSCCYYESLHVLFGH